MRQHSKYINVDPIFNSPGGVYFADIDQNDGIYGDTFWKALALLMVAIMQFLFALYVRKLLNKIFPWIPNQKNTNKSAQVKTNPAPIRVLSSPDNTKQNKAHGEDSKPASSLNPASSLKPASSVTKDLTDGGTGTKRKSGPTVQNKLKSLSKHMALSAMCMSMAATLISVGGIVGFYPYTQPRPYTYSFLYMFPFWLIQASSILEVSAVEETLMDMLNKKN
jgi:hypothetical protein